MSKMLPAYRLAALSAALLLVAAAFAHATAGAENRPRHNPPPDEPPSRQSSEPGKPPLVAGTLRDGETRVVDVSDSADDRGGSIVAVNVAGEGMLVLETGRTRVTYGVDRDGTTTITPGPGGPIVLSGAGGVTPGTVEIRSTPDDVTYSLLDPGEKTARVGRAQLTLPDTATITRSDARTSYELRGTGACSGVLDSKVANDFSADDEIACSLRSYNGAAEFRAIGAPAAKASVDTIRTGNLRDQLSTGPGADRIRTRGGDDLVLGGSGRDVVLAGAGTDGVFGNVGNDRIHGGSGDDTISPGAGRDRVSGGSGDDVVFSRSEGLDTISCGHGDDTVYAGPSDVVARDCEEVHRP